MKHHLVDHMLGSAAADPTETATEVPPTADHHHHHTRMEK
jgi:hypothetical protein